jgi:hypothetical protein
MLTAYVRFPVRESMKNRMERPRKFDQYNSIGVN